MPAFPLLLALLTGAPAPSRPFFEEQTATAELVLLASAGSLRAPDANAASDAPGDDETEADNPASTELEEMRALEDAVMDPAPKTTGTSAQEAVQALGFGNPTKARMEDALEDPEMREEGLGADLPPVTNVLAFDVRSVAAEYDIPVEMQPLVAQYIQFFRGPGRHFFQKWMERSSRYIPVMTPILEAQGVPKDLVYLSMIESGFSMQAYSWAKAAGPWQFISGTAKTFGLKQDFWVDERRDPVKATGAAARYLKQLKVALGDWYLAWAGYNAGAGRVRHVIHKKGSNDFWALSEGKGLAKETKHYVPKLIAAALVAKHPKAFGFNEDEFSYEPQMEFDEVQLTDPTDLEIVARSAGVELDDVKALNPELKRWCTPPATPARPYLLRLPKGSREAFTVGFARIAPRDRLSFKVYRVRRGDTLSRIARSFQTAPEAILQLNQLRSARMLRVSADLVIPVPPTKATNRASATAALSPALERQALKARRSGFAAAAPEEEIPAGTATRSKGQGQVTTDLVNGKQRLTYAVEGGDSLWTVSQRFGCSVEEIRRWNHVSHKSRGLRVGTLLTLWPAKNVSVEDRAGTLVAQKLDDRRRHTLNAGETLWSVAQAYHVRLEDLRRWNGITEDRSVQIGTSLLLSPAAQAMR